MQTDRTHSFFRPLWVRVSIVAFCFAWSAFEWWNGESVWGVLTFAMGLYGIWAFFVSYDPDGAGK